ncbi:hypothetical protein FDB64_12335 [Clostridium botulinum]|nr:hypothetical protein [Clostridium botulinum]NFM05039.1 hypothetical protein [Clostridium botulinum]NFO40970.1 hypothetical protein [Clostridium botulinum]
MNLAVNKNERKILVLFFLIIVISQGIRTDFNNKLNTCIFNYHIIPLLLVLITIFNKKNKINIKNIIFIIGIIGLIVLSFVINKYTYNQFFRTILSFILPLFILLIDYNNFNSGYIISKLVSIFNIFIQITFIIQVLMSINTGRSPGIIGHSLTTGWYYVIFISFNCIYCKYFKSKSDILILKDVFIALIGTVLATGRVSMSIVLILGIIYTIACCKNKVLIFIIPILIIIFLNTSFVDKLIWEKFRYAASWGDITNGRLLGIREMQFYSIKPNFFYGKGLGYSNYITQYLFGTINFENPILMFSFDYGILTVIFLLIIIFINPLKAFIDKKNFLIAINFILVFIVPFTYNGLAESVGLFIVLIFIIYIFLLINNAIAIKKLI